MITIEEARNHPKYSAIPPAVLDDIYAYVNRRVPPGGFLYNVLCNELFHAVANADAQSFASLQTILLFIFNEVRCDCYGTPQKVSAWLNPDVFTPEPERIHEPATEH